MRNDGFHSKDDVCGRMMMEKERMVGFMEKRWVSGFVGTCLWAGMMFITSRERKANRPGRLGLARCRCPRVCGEDQGRGEAAMASILIGTMAVTLGIGAAETVRRVMSTPQVTRGRANTHTRKTSD